MRARDVMAACWILAAAPAIAEGQDWTYRARLTAEAGTVLARERWRASHLLVAAADGAWERGRVKLAGGVVAAASHSETSVVAREAYARGSVTSWMDVEAGKRLLRWGVGYGYAPTGVLDPPRDPADPADRFGRREGLALARADLFAAGASFSLVAASVDAKPLAAMRIKTVVRGFDMSAIASVRDGTAPSFGANVTQVVGERLEWHAEVLSHSGQAGRGRALSAAAGIQYTVRGTNVVMEYHRRDGGHVLFGRAARANGDSRAVPEVIVSRTLDDGRWTLVGVLGIRAGRRLVIHGRATSAAGARALAAGATARF